MSDAIALLVAEKPCDQCLFSTAKVVPDTRRDEILAAVRADESHFICHKFSIALDRGKLTESEANVCCHGFYTHEDTLELRLARTLNIVQFVPLPEG